MAKINTFRCTGRECRYVIRTVEGFPVWHSHTPKQLRKLPVPPMSREYVAGYRSELLCRYCKKTVDAGDDLVCPRCMRGGIYINEAGHLCPQCVVGTLSLSISQFCK